MKPLAALAFALVIAAPRSARSEVPDAPYYVLLHGAVSCTAGDQSLSEQMDLGGALATELNGLPFDERCDDSCDNVNGRCDALAVAQTIAASAALGRVHLWAAGVSANGVHPSNQAGMDVSLEASWGDTLTITSSTLATGDPVDLKIAVEAYMNGSGDLPPPDCSATNSESILEIGGASLPPSPYYEIPALELHRPCGQGPRHLGASEVVQARVGDTLAIKASADAYAVTRGDASTDASVDADHSGPFHWYIDVVTPGATYRSASGTTYFDPHPVSIPASHPVVELTHLSTPAADDGISITGEVRLPPASAALFDPPTSGVRIVLENGQLLPITDVLVPPGLFDAVSHSGWTVNKARTVWTFKSRKGVEGINKVSLKIAHKAPGVVMFAVSGKNGSYFIGQNIMDGSPFPVPLTAWMQLRPDMAYAGACAQLSFPGDSGRTCAVDATGNTLTCK